MKNFKMLITVNQLVKRGVVVLLTLCLTIVFSCQEKSKEEKMHNDMTATSEGQQLSSEEKLYRPNYHFTPQENWINDPNGMFYFNGYYHLYFQYHPDGNTWGPMHWGHAISDDLMVWKEQPIALYPDSLGYIFSGSAVVDIDNTSGFGKDGKIPIVAMFTSHDPQKAEEDKVDVETQSIAYSLDEGLTYTKYEGNPVIENPEIRDFRDPKVLWDEVHQKWVLVLAADDKIMFYESDDLKNWKLLSDFGKNIGAHGGVWECPDLFPLKAQDSDEVKWVLLVSINPGGPNGGSATQYFIGDFDGTNFVLDSDFESELQEEHDFWIDFGKDNYAGVTWSNAQTKDNGKYFIGWMSNWQYANEVPTETWRGAMTVPRELQVVKSAQSYRLTFKPVEQLESYRGKKYRKEDVAISKEELLIDSQKIDLSRAEVNFEIADPEAGFKFTLSNQEGDTLAFGYKATDRQFYIDRSQAGKTQFSEEFAKRISTAPRLAEGQGISGKILLDKTSLELFYDGGTTVMTEIFFPNAPFEELSLTPEKQEFTLDHIEIHELNF